MITSVSEIVDNFALFVGSLSSNTTQEQLIQYFSRFGQIQGANLITDWATGKDFFNYRSLKALCYRFLQRRKDMCQSLKPEDPSS